MSQELIFQLTHSLIKGVDPILKFQSFQFNRIEKVILNKV